MFFQWLRFIIWNRKKYRKNSNRYRYIEKCRYPRDRKFLIYAVQRDLRDNSVKKNIIAKLPYPQEREFLTALATGETTDTTERAAAVSKLVYPDDREALIKVAGMNINARFLSEKGPSQIAVEKLPYPQEKDALIDLARNSLRRDAMWKLDRLAEREIIEEIALTAPNELFRDDAIDMLPYPQSRETLIRIARTSSNKQNRREAVKRLPYPEEAKVLKELAGGDGAVAETAQIIIADAGVCPLCGGKVSCAVDYQYFNNDYNDYCRQENTYRCSACGWSLKC